MIFNLRDRLAGKAVFSKAELSLILGLYGDHVKKGIWKDYAIDSLPGRDDLKAAGLLSADIPRDFDFAASPRDPETGELLGEDPLEDADFQPDFLEGAEDRP